VLGDVQDARKRSRYSNRSWRCGLRTGSCTAHWCEAFSQSKKRFHQEMAEVLRHHPNLKDLLP
jgi:heterodisulfide reductase subunit C